MPQYILNGLYVPRKGASWASANWSRVVKAHTKEIPSLFSFFPDTFDVFLTTPWTPPGDDNYRLAAYLRGKNLNGNYDNGGDFLLKGNYVLPTPVLSKVNGSSFAGYLYYAGSPTCFVNTDQPNQIIRPCLQILSPVDIVSKLKLKSGLVTVELK